jgi:hypothetical protein
MTSRERIIDLVTKINAARDQLGQLETELDQLLPSTRGRPRGAVKGKRAPRGSLSNRVVQLLESEPKRAFSVTDVAQHIGPSSLDSLRKTVMRLAAQRRINRRQRGLYGAAKRRGR